MYVKLMGIKDKYPYIVEVLADSVTLNYYNMLTHLTLLHMS